MGAISDLTRDLASRVYQIYYNKDIHKIPFIIPVAYAAQSEVNNDNVNYYILSRIMFHT